MFPATSRTQCSTLGVLSSSSTEHPDVSGRQLSVFNSNMAVYHLTSGPTVVEHFILLVRAPLTPITLSVYTALAYRLKASQSCLAASGTREHIHSSVVLTEVRSRVVAVQSFFSACCMFLPGHSHVSPLKAGSVRMTALHSTAASSPSIPASQQAPYWAGAHQALCMQSQTRLHTSLLLDSGPVQLTALCDRQVWANFAGYQRSNRQSSHMVCHAHGRQECNGQDSREGRHSLEADCGRAPSLRTGTACLKPGAEPPGVNALLCALLAASAPLPLNEICTRLNNLLCSWSSSE